MCVYVHCVGVYSHGFACMCVAVQSVWEVVHVPGKPDTPLAHPHRRETLLLLGLWTAVYTEELPEPTLQDSHRLASGLLVTLLNPVQLNPVNQWLACHTAEPSNQIQLTPVSQWLACHTAVPSKKPDTTQTSQPVACLSHCCTLKGTRYNSDQSASGLLVTLLYPQRNQIQLTPASQWLACHTAVPSKKPDTAHTSQPVACLSHCYTLKPDKTHTSQPVACLSHCYTLKPDKTHTRQPVACLLHCYTLKPDKTQTSQPAAYLSLWWTFKETRYHTSQAVACLSQCCTLKTKTKKLDATSSMVVYIHRHSMVYKGQGKSGTGSVSPGPPPCSHSSWAVIRYRIQDDFSNPLQKCSHLPSNVLQSQWHPPEPVTCKEARKGENCALAIALVNNSWSHSSRLRSTRTTGLAFTPKHSSVWPAPCRPCTPSPAVTCCISLPACGACLLVACSVQHVEEIKT